MAIEIGPGWTIGGGITVSSPPSTPTAGWFSGGVYSYNRVTTVSRVTFATDTVTASVRGPLSIVQSYMAASTDNTTYGWIGGGSTGPGTITSIVNRITYATDTATSTLRGPLSAARQYLAAAGNSTDGWFAGGIGSGGNTSLVDRITYATDTATASVRGPLSIDGLRWAAAGTSTDGWFAGGQTGSLRISSIQRITYATDTATASNRGPLNFGRQSSAASTDSTTYGWFGGGAAAPAGGGTYISNVERITYATDTDVTSTRGPLTSARYNLAATGTADYGWFGGGSVSGSPYNSSVVDRITYATDTATASVRGTLGNERWGLAAAGDNTTYGWYGGGFQAPNTRSNVRRITYATDTAVAVNRGPLSSAKYKLAAAGNSDYGWFGGGTTAPQLSTIDRITYATDTATASVRGPLNYEIDSLAATSGLQ